MDRIVKGKYNTAYIKTENLEEYSEAQVKQICDQECNKDTQIVCMPDIHPGKVGPIGLTMRIKDKVIPALVGVDIGCGVYAAKIKCNRNIDYNKLDVILRDKIPTGFSQRKRSDIVKYDLSKIEDLRCYHHISPEKANSGFGTLGSGNHFVEIDQNEKGETWLVIHTGSRSLGFNVAQYWQNRAHQTSKNYGQNVPELSWLESYEIDDYIHDLQICQEYAHHNRVTIAKIICKNMKFKIEDEIDSVHNFIGVDRILRKGAISAKEGERVVIPINSVDGTLIGVGKGLNSWNQSAPHGSGRTMSRKEAKNSLIVSDIKKEMSKNKVHGNVNKYNLEESFKSYRSIDLVLPFLQGNVDVTERILPKYNYKDPGKVKR